MIVGERCVDCGAVLRRGHHADRRCGLCQRKRAMHSTAFRMPDGFFSRPTLAAALDRYRFGPVFRAVRAQAGLTQQELAELLGTSQGSISMIENGKRRVDDLGLVVRFANAFGVPPRALGFRAATVGGRAGVSGRDDEMDRRGLIGSLASIALGVTGSSGLDLDRLTALLAPDPAEKSARQIGVNDVVHLEQLAAEFEHMTHAQGGGVVRDQAADQVRAALPLLGLPMPDGAVRDRLHTAIVHLSLIGGWAAFDTDRHDQARRMWHAGLYMARDSSSPASADLVSHLMFVLAQQALELDKPAEAQHLCALGQASAMGSPHVSPSTETCLAVNTAFSLAQRGHDPGRALATAENNFERIDLDSTSPWACVDGEVKMTTWRGHAFYQRGRVTGDPRWVGAALPDLQRATANPRTMSTALYKPELAGALALTGDVDAAVTEGHRAVELISGLTSSRARRRLTELVEVLRPMSKAAGVAELRERIAGLQPV